MIRGLERVAADRRHLIAQQVRCSTGFTWGRIAVDGARAVVARPPRAQASLADARTAAEARARELHRLLLGWPEGNFLPPATDLARLLGCSQGTHGNQAVDRVARAFTTLQTQGVLATMAGSRDQFRGQRMVLLRKPARMLRTEGAPAFWEHGLREALA